MRSPSLRAEIVPSPDVTPAVAIVLVTYHGASNLDRLWRSVNRLDYPRSRWSLLVVENDPERRAAGWFAAHAPAVRVVVPGTNTGYAGGNAIGMDAALAAGVDHVAIVTQDTEVDRAWLRELVAVAERHPRAGAVQPKLLRRGPDGRPVIHSWGNELHYVGVGYLGGDGQADRELEVRPIACASGAGVMYRAEALREVGLLDGELFMYHEDCDLSWRLRLAGWDVLLAPRAVMSHDHVFHASAQKFYLLERNRLVNLLTHYRVRTLALLGPALAAFEACTLGYALLGGWLGRRLAVYGFFLRPRTWRYLARKRRQVQAVRRLPDRALAGHLAARIEFGPLDGPLLRWLVNPAFAAYWRLVRPLIRW